MTSDDILLLSPQSDNTTIGEVSDESTLTHDVTWGRLLTLVGVGLSVVLLAGGLWWSSRPEAPQPKIPLDAWAPYWTLNDSIPEAAKRLPLMREISPFWYEVQGVDRIVVSEFADSDMIEKFDAVARRSGVLIVPSVVDALPAGEMAAIIADPKTRSAHVKALAEFAIRSDYDGIDLNYEKFAFSDDRNTWAETRPNWVAFVEELAGLLDGSNRTLTVSIPPIYNAERTKTSGFWVYDHGAIAPFVDRIRIMAYDFSVSEPGPIAPLSFVERSIDGVIAATGDPSKIVLGLAAYGRNWPIGISGMCPDDEDVPGRTTVTARSVDDLIERRGAIPVAVGDTGEWAFRYELEITDGTTSCVQTRQVHYVDADGVRERMDLARAKKLNGVSLWAFGFDDKAVWDAILPTVKSGRDNSSS